MNQEQADAYWKANIRLIGILLAVWAIVSYGMGILFYAAFPEFTLPGFQIPLGFWFAHQGAMLVFIVLIIVYAKTMDKIDAEHDVQE